MFLFILGFVIRCTERFFDGLTFLWDNLMVLFETKHERPRKKVFIVGGGFAGILAAREMHKFDVTLVDQKDYFEYTPGILRCFVEPEHFPNISIKYRDLIRNNNSYKHVTFVEDCVEKIEQDAIITKHKGQFTFDYLIISCGTGYSHPIGVSSTKWEERMNHFFEEYQTLKNADKIVVAGSGPVGVELCAEIVEKFPEKQVHLLVGNSDSLLNNFPSPSGEYSQKFFERKGVCIYPQECLEKVENNQVFTSKGRKIKADQMYWCIGKSVASKPVGSHFPQATKKLANFFQQNSICVNDYLQIEGYSNIYVVGDVAETKFPSRKLGFNAELSASLVIHNIERQEKGLSPFKFPEAKTQTNSIPLIAVVSLGKFDATIILNNFVWGGKLAAFSKWFVEWSKMLQVKGNILGKLIWYLADKTVLLSHRYIFVPLGKIPPKQ